MSPFQGWDLLFLYTGLRPVLLYFAPSGLGILMRCVLQVFFWISGIVFLGFSQYSYYLFPDN